MAPTELEIVAMIQKLFDRGRSRPTVVGIGDDTAVMESPGRGHEMLLTTDQIIENTHFIKSRHPARALGHKVLARGLSDIAAMGGAPACSLLSLALPKWITRRWLTSFFSGFLQLSRLTETPLVGGDVARGGSFCASVTVLGSVPRGKALTRRAARPSEMVYVSGRLGGSACGLDRLLRLPADSRVFRHRVVRRHLYPEPRLALGRYLREKLGATAAMDLSDGLASDLARLVKASGVGAVIDAARMPVFRGATLDQALYGGEEYELLFTLPPRKRVPAVFQGIPLSCIGAIRGAPGVALRTASGIRPLKPGGFQHFR